MKEDVLRRVDCREETSQFYPPRRDLEEGDLPGSKYPRLVFLVARRRVTCTLAGGCVEEEEYVSSSGEMQPLNFVHRVGTTLVGSGCASRCPWWHAPVGGGIGVGAEF